MAQQAVFDARAEIAQVTVSDVVERYLLDLIFATRYPERYDEDLRRWIQVGASPRGALRAWHGRQRLVRPSARSHDL